MIIADMRGGALANAVNWIESTLLGSVATTAAVIAVAILGFGMLWGRFDVRTAARVALGAFILFGAPLIAYELTSVLSGGERASPDLAQIAQPIPAAPTVPKNAPVNDPYAGASVPQLQ